METEKSLIGLKMIIISVVIIGIILGIGFLVLEEFKKTIQSIDSNNETYLENTNTEKNLSQIPTILTAQTYNQTWLDFDSLTDNVNLSVSNIVGTSNFTLCSTFYINGVAYSTGAAYGRLFGADYLNIYYDYANNFWGVDDGVLKSFSRGFTKKNWTEACFVVNSDCIASAFLNGQFSGSGSCGVRDADNLSRSDYIGNNNLINRAFNGSISKVIIFNKTLSEAEVLNYRGVTGGYVPFLLYHGVNDTLVSNYSWAVTVSDFNNTLKWFNDSGYVTISQYDYFLWTQGLKNISSKSFVITFDDIFLDHLYTAAPMMAQYNFTGVEFVSTEKVNTTSDVGGVGVRFMNWTDIQSLYDNYGWEIGSHGKTHCDMVNTCKTPAQWISELNGSYNDIVGNLTGIIPYSFAYPFFNRNASTDSYVAQYYNSSVTSFTSGYNSFTPFNLYALDRYSMLNSTTLTTIALVFVVDKSDFNSTSYNNSIILKLNFNENSGTTAYDVSGYGNNGTISGATWKNDGVLVSLTNIVDYTISASTFKLINDVYSYSLLYLNYDYVILKASQTTITNIIDSIKQIPIWLSIIIILLIVGILLAIVFKIIPLKNSGEIAEI